ncbi:MAG: SGNH/GDSL hydrolase family protein, partial [Actinomycetota bacterium]
AGPRSGHAGPDDTDPDAATPLSVLMIGESTAVGVGVATQEEALAGRLAHALARGSGRQVAWTALGRSGAPARHVLRVLVPQVEGSYDVAVVVLGVNDTLSLTSLRAWRATVGAVLDALEPHVADGGTVVLAGLPAVGRFVALPQPTRALLGRHARALDDELAAIAGHRERTLHVRTPVLGSGPLLAVDRFHPSAMGYDLWAAELGRGLSG